MTDADDSRRNQVDYGGWCAPSWHPCPTCGGEICVCFTRPPLPQCIGDCGPECAGTCFLEVFDE